MKFAIKALLFTAVAYAAEGDAEEETESSGASKGGACDSGKDNSGCAEGLRCHLGGTATSAT